MEPLIPIPHDSQSIVTSLSGPVWLHPNGIAMVVLGNEPEHTLFHAKSQVQAFEKICGGEPRPLLADFTRTKNISKDAREFYKGIGTTHKICALAIVSASKVGFLVANFFVGVNLQTQIPICLCENAETAMDWLKQFSKTTVSC